MNLKERVQELCKREKISMNQLEEELGFGKGYISKLGKSIPNTAKIQKIANRFNVPLEYLMGKEGLVKCPVCGLEYLSSSLEDCKIHEEHHRAFENAVKKFGTIYSSTFIETLKNKYLNQATDNRRSIENRINDWIEVIRTYWSRSLCGCNYDLSHPDFDKYASMLLNQNHFKERIGNDSIYERLVSMYGTSEGIEEGKSYYIPKEKPIAFTAKDERDIKKDLENLRKKLTNKELGPAAYDGDDISDDDADLFLGQVELMLRRLKLKNKEKYNPNKNKK